MHLFFLFPLVAGASAFIGLRNFSFSSGSRSTIMRRSRISMMCWRERMRDSRQNQRIFLAASILTRVSVFVSIVKSRRRPNLRPDFETTVLPMKMHLLRPNFSILVISKGETSTSLSRIRIESVCHFSISTGTKTRAIPIKKAMIWPVSGCTKTPFTLPSGRLLSPSTTGMPEMSVQLRFIERGYALQRHYYHYRLYPCKCILKNTGFCAIII